MKLNVTLSGDKSMRRKLKEIGQQLAGRALAATAVDVERYIEGQAAKHNGKGDLVRSIYKRREGQAWEIGHDPRVAPHALFVHWGTGLWGPKRAKYPIKPRNKKALRWPAGGAFKFSKGVMHPGIPPDLWLVRAARQAPLDFARHVERQLARIRATP